MLQRLIVVDLQDGEARPRALVNSVIVECRPIRERFVEGCLSMPGVTGLVERDVRITVAAPSPEGDPVRIEAEGDPADRLQHEIDHLDGSLFLDCLSPLERRLVLNRYQKLRWRIEA